MKCCFKYMLLTAFFTGVTDVGRFWGFVGILVLLLLLLNGSVSASDVYPAVVVVTVAVVGFAESAEGCGGGTGPGAVAKFYPILAIG